MASEPLLPSVARGDAAAFEQLYDRYSPALYALLLRILGNPAEAQEVLRETFGQVWTNAFQFDSTSGSEEIWLTAMARSHGVDRLRSRRDAGPARPPIGNSPMTHDKFESIAALDALGAASAEEASLLRSHVDTCESCRRARDDFREAAAMMARDLDPVTPPPEVRQHILDTAQTGDTTLTERHRSIIRPWWLATAATLFLALWGWRELAIRTAREQMASQTAEIRQLKEENDRLTQQLARLNSEVTLLAAPGTKVMTVAGKGITGRAFLDGTGRGLVIIDTLPAAEKSYEIFISRTDQPKPQSVATLAPGSKSVHLANLPPRPQIKAITVR